jgi:two-component system invasion response regulator UvrY
MEPKYKIALVDDHIMTRTGVAVLINGFGSFEILFEADNGVQFIEQMKKHEVPDVVLLDIKMKEMDGFDTCLWIKKNYPQIHVLVLSMYEDEIRIIRMLKAGAQGYLLKAFEPRELNKALLDVIHKNYYNSDFVTGKLIHTINNIPDSVLPKLNENEIAFIRLCFTELTYKEIADEMHKHFKTVDGYRDVLFEKFNVKSRVGLVLYALKNGIVHLDS